MKQYKKLILHILDNKDNMQIQRSFPKRALVTLAIGEKYYNLWQTYCKWNWEKYAEKHNLDIIIIDQPLDKSERALNRSPAWQKCLIFNHEKVKKYDQILWIDSDIIINYNIAPNIFTGVHDKTIGAVDYFTIPDRLNCQNFQKKIYNYYKNKGQVINKDYSPKQYYENANFNSSFDEVVHTGIMVCSPQYHQKLYNNVYTKYNSDHPHYEMPYLSYELIKNCNIRWLDYKFNNLWLIYKYMYYDFLINKQNNRFLKIYNWFNTLNLTQKAIKNVYTNSYFLHFAGGQGDMKQTEFLKTI